VSTFKQRVEAMTETRHLGEIDVPLAAWRRLVAMRERLIKEDPSLASEPARGMEHVVFAAIMQGLTADEQAYGLTYDENTGHPLLSANDQAVLDRIRSMCGPGSFVRAETLRVRLIGLTRSEIDESLDRLVKIGFVAQRRNNSYEPAS